MTLKRRLIYDGLWGDQLVGVAADKRHTEIRLTNFDTAAAIIRKHHYSKSTPFIPSLICHLVYWQGEVHGALMLGYGQNPARNETSEGIAIEFDRMWLSDDMPKYSETCVIGLLHTWLRKAQPQIAVIRSWSDTGEGNQGTIYRAANYNYVRQVGNAFYLLPSGRKIHRVTLWHMHGTPGNRWDWLQQKYPGIKKLDGDQLLFEYWLDPKRKPK